VFLPSTLHTNFDVLGTEKNHIDGGKEAEKECGKCISHNKEENLWHNIVQ
jgi:hypothetical protein